MELLNGTIKKLLTFFILTMFQCHYQYNTILANVGGMSNKVGIIIKYYSC